MADVFLGSTFEDTFEEFSYGYRDENKIKRLTVSVPIPLKISAKEFAFRLINAHKIPCYLEEDLTSAFKTFLKKSETSLYDKMAALAIGEVLTSNQTANDCINVWANTFKQEHSEYCVTSDMSEDAAFADIYHSLIHSAALETLLQLENSYAMSLQELLSHRDNALTSAEEKHRKELENAISDIGLTSTDRDVSNIAARHCEQSQMLETYWSSELSQLQELQKREYREWVLKVHEDSKNPNGGDSLTAASQFNLAEKIQVKVYAKEDDVVSDIQHSSRTRSVSTLSVPTPEEFSTEPEVKIEESFTIHLGAQQKTMHNLRLICGDVLDMCRHKAPPGGSVFSQPHRIQTALSLYSETLAGLILLVDNRLDNYTGIMKDFAAICQQSTEFHFPDLDQQLCLIQQSVENRTRSKSSTGGIGGRVQSPPEDDVLRVPTLNAGDFYVTRHSNLAEVQVVFHLIVDDTVKSASLNSRNPSIVGLRHVLHTAVRYNITTLTIPLLLFHEMTDEMTVNWCVKRAELVLKCVKGFMMECASWSGVESLNVQFMIPKGISVDMFNTISNMLPNIFRISTPLDLTSTNR